MHNNTHTKLFATLAENRQGELQQFFDSTKGA